MFDKNVYKMTVVCCNYAVASRVKIGGGVVGVGPPLSDPSGPVNPVFL